MICELRARDIIALHQFHYEGRVKHTLSSFEVLWEPRSLVFGICLILICTLQCWLFGCNPFMFMIWVSACFSVVFVTSIISDFGGFHSSEPLVTSWAT